MTDITPQLVTVLREHLRFLEDGQELPMTAELTELGLDSMGAVDLLLDLEESFAIAFPDEMLGPETFRTPDTLREAIVSLQENGGTG